MKDYTLQEYPELKTLGLDTKEIRVYLTLLGSQPLTVAELSQKAAIHRPTLYQLLPQLLEKGLVSTQQKGKRLYYQAQPPNKLQLLAEESLKDLEALIPELEATYEQTNEKPEINYLEGASGIKFVFFDIVNTLKKGGVFYRYSSAQASVRNRNVLPKNYRQKRDAKQIERYVISNESIEKAATKDLGRATKIVPAKYGLFDYNITQVIYGHKIAFIDYETQTALIITHRRIAEFQEKIFKMNYDLL